MSICSLTVLVSNEATAMQISCESKRVAPQYGFYEKSCFMQTHTRIDSDDTTIVPDSTVSAVAFGGNKKISFLPVELASSFPMLKRFGAVDCSVRSVAKVHFKGLKMLENLFLDGNQIQKIPSDAFEDLVALKNLHMSKKFVFLYFTPIPLSFFELSSKSNTVHKRTSFRWSHQLDSRSTG